MLLNKICQNIWIYLVNEKIKSSLNSFERNILLRIMLTSPPVSKVTLEKWVVDHKKDQLLDTLRFFLRINVLFTDETKSISFGDNYLVNNDFCVTLLRFILCCFFTFFLFLFCNYILKW